MGFEKYYFQEKSAAWFFRIAALFSLFVSVILIIAVFLFSSDFESGFVPWLIFVNFVIVFFPLLMAELFLRVPLLSRAKTYMSIKKYVPWHYHFVGLYKK